MKSEQIKEMMRYYDERAEEYDEVYFGKIPRMYTEFNSRIAAKIIKLNREDVKDLIKIAGKFGHGHLIDIGGGTGFWLQYYAGNCKHITLIDQSKMMLRVCRRRIKELGIRKKCRLINDDFFKTELPESSYDCVFIGFLLSHLSAEDETTFFKKLKIILKPKATILIFDSAWSPMRKKIRSKEGHIDRILNDGRKFNIYKRYFARSDVTRMFTRQGLIIVSLQMGSWFFAVSGTYT